MYRVFFFVALLLPTAVYAQSGWYELSSGVGATLNDVAFTTVDRGYAVGDSGTAIRTSDGGQTWQSMEMPAPVDTTAVLRRVVFTSQSVGYIVGSTGSRHKGLAYVRPIILKTEDGGEGWRVVRIDTLGEYRDVEFVTGDVGYVVGDGARGQDPVSLVVKTRDGGESWESQVSGETIYQINKFVEFRDTSVGMMSVREQNQAEYYYSLVGTKDGGMNWEELMGISSIGQYNGIHYLHDRTWLVSGWLGIFRTEDDGMNWTKVYNQQSIWNFGFFGEKVGYGVVDGDTPGGIVKTSDGGVSWREETVPDNQFRYYGISAPGLNVAYAVGRNGVILKTVDGGGTPVGVEERREREERLRIDPVPTRGSVRCGYGVRQEDRRLEVVDILGRVVMEQKIAAGSSEAVIETGGLSAGVYVCRLGDRTAIMVVAR